MASEQPELLFFDTFSHETSEKLHEGDDITDGLLKNLRENGDHLPNELTLMKKIKEDTHICNIPLKQIEGSLSLPELKTPISLDEQDEDLLTVENMGTSDCDLCELEIKNIDGSTETLECKRDLWIPSIRTEHALAMEMRYFHFPDRDLLTFPEICEDELTSRLDHLTATLGEMGATCTIPYTQNVSRDEYGLLELVHKEAFSSAVNLTARLLMVHRMSSRKNNEPIRHSPRSIQLWFSRLALLVKMQEFKLAEAEACQWGDCNKPDLYYQFYPDIYNGRRGSMVPFQMRLLLANLPSYCGRHSESLEKLFSILANVRKILQNLGSEVACQSELQITDFTAVKHLWDAREKRVLISIVNVAVKMKDFILAVEVINGMITNESAVTKKQILYSTLGRIHLQFGDLTSAEKFFSIARSDFSGNTSLNCDLQRDFQNTVDFGLLAVARNDFLEAYRYFEKASFIDPSSLMVMNNCATCLFYLGHLREGIRLLTGAVNNDPLHALHDGLILNLCTMYELSSANCKEKKIQLLKFATLFKGNSINVSSFRLF